MQLRNAHIACLHTHSLAHICVWMIIMVAIPRYESPTETELGQRGAYSLLRSLFVCLFARFLPANPSAMNLPRW